MIAGLHHASITTADIQRLKAAGMRFHCPPQYLAGLCGATYGRDPDGNIVELMQPDPSGAFAR
jgi:hypothetical protein